LRALTACLRVGGDDGCGAAWNVVKEPYVSGKAHGNVKELNVWIQATDSSYRCIEQVSDAIVSLVMLKYEVCSLLAELLWDARARGTEKKRE
jgi:hypothetical protein